MPDDNDITDEVKEQLENSGAIGESSDEDDDVVATLDEDETEEEPSGTTMTDAWNDRYEDEEGDNE